MQRSAKILILIWEEIIKKIPMSVELWVGRRKEPILCYVAKNYEKKNSGSKGRIQSVHNLCVFRILKKNSGRIRYKIMSAIK